VSTMVARRALRTLAIVIAMAAWLDPSYAARSRPRIAIIDATTSGVATTTSGVAGRDLAENARNRESTSSFGMATPDVVFLAGQLADAAVLSHGRNPDTDAWVVVADDEEAEIPAPPPGVSLSLVVPRRPSAAIVVEALEAPARVSPGTRVPVTATVSARGLKGQTSSLVVRSGPLELARLAHRWTADTERFTARFNLFPPSAGVNHLTVDVLDNAGRSRQSRADAVVVVDDTPLPVLVFEGRPSWTTTFVRRALETDPRFAVTSATRVSRDIVAGVRVEGVRVASAGPAGSRPPARIERLTTSVLAPFATVIVGAPETLSQEETAALREYVARGSALVLAPDRRPAGAYTSLLASATTVERLLDEPLALALAHEQGIALLASELAETRALPAGARLVTKSSAQPNPLPARASVASAASIWITPSGAGQILFVGALDAWRFRGRTGDGFDRWWPQVIDWLAREATGALTIACEPQVATPGARVSVRVRAPRTGAAESTSVSASLDTLTPRGEGRGEGNPVRLWPDAEPGVFTGTLNAPTGPGVYAVSARGAQVGAGAEWTAQTPLIVDAGARRARGADDRWRAATESRGGVAVTRDHIDRVMRAVQHRPAARAGSGRIWPMRSAWWLLPFAACLGGEWWLRRRAGLR
jgi:hypothetical protein